MRANVICTYTLRLGNKTKKRGNKFFKLTIGIKNFSSLPETVKEIMPTKDVTMPTFGNYIIFSSFKSYKEQKVFFMME